MLEKPVFYNFTHDVMERWAGVRPDAGEWKRYEEPIRRFVDGGLMETCDGLLRLTAHGVMVSNDVFQEFLTA